MRIRHVEAEREAIRSQVRRLADGKHALEAKALASGRRGRTLSHFCRGAKIADRSDVALTEATFVDLDKQAKRASALLQSYTQRWQRAGWEA